MEQKEIAAFIQWLPQNIEEFKDRTPEECAERLNQMSQSEEGMNVVKQLITQFQKSLGMFREGGKLNYLVKKFQTGGKYNRQAARERKQGLRPDDEFMAGNQNVLAKKAKAMNVDGFDESMYNMDPGQTFDRNRYRERKRDAREMHPEWTRRQRKAYALMDKQPYEPINPQVNFTPPSVGIPELPSRPRGIVAIGDMSSEILDNPKNYKQYEVVKHTPKYRRMSYDQFATYANNYLKNAGAFRNGVDLATMQAYVEDQYDKYAQQGLDYVWQNPEEGANLKVASNWRSKYGAANSNPNNWGNVDRSGEIDFNGGKSVRMAVDPDGSRYAVYHTINGDRLDEDAYQQGKYIIQKSANGYDPERAANNRFTSSVASNDYRSDWNLGRSFADSDVSWAGQQAMGALGRIGLATAAGSALGAIPGAGLAVAGAGFANNYLGGAYNGALINETSSMPTGKGSWVTQGRGYEWRPGGTGGGGSYVSPSKHWAGPQGNSDYMRRLRWLGGSDDGSTFRAYRSTPGPTTNSLMERLRNFDWRSGARGGAVLGGVIGGATQAYDEYGRAMQPRTDYTPFTPQE